MKVTVCELRDASDAFAQDWARLAAHVQAEGSDLVLLPEMPFFPWFALTRPFDEPRWQAAVAAHAAWLERLPELAPAVVLGTRPVNGGANRRGGANSGGGPRRANEAFVWDAEQGYRAAHHKYYLPDEPGFWEASWYQRGEGDFAPVTCGPALAGFQVCTELWFMGHGRAYGKQGAQIIASPRCTPLPTADKWLAGGRALAVVSGAFSLSSNHAGPASDGMPMGGLGWVIDPDGNVLGTTSPERPFVTVEIDLAAADAAKQTYPRYVLD